MGHRIWAVVLRIAPAPVPDTLVSERGSGEREVELSGAFAEASTSTSGGRLRSI